MESFVLTPHILKNSWSQTHAFCLFPRQLKGSLAAVFSHGYTASKSDCLPWATRCVEAGIPCVIFDWPGHRLGHFYELEDFSEFKLKAHCLFEEAAAFLSQKMQAQGLAKPQKWVLGGHSLGALLALKALNLATFNQHTKVAIAVGLGLNHKVETHIFDTAFYQKTLELRRQLVSPSLDSHIVFPWIRQEKENLKLSNQRIHLITGEDDMVVGADGTEVLAQFLTQQGNEVSLFKPKRLAHHEPQMAAAHLFAFLKQEFLT
jgi:predicted esterase